MGELEALRERLSPELRRWLRHQGIPESDHDDLLQDTFLALWSREDVYSPDAFVRATLHHRVLHFWRRHYRRGEIPLEALSGEPKTQALQGNVDTRQDVERAVRQLRPRERGIAWLKLERGLSCTEIATLTHETPKAVANVWWRARRKIKKLLGRKPPPEEPASATR